MKDKFNQSKYIQEYSKEHYKAFKVDLRKDEYERIDKFLQEHNITKAQFLRDAIEEIIHKKKCKDNVNKNTKV